MDGASKFVRGDAIAGLMIMVLNVVGGLLVGVVQHGMELGAAAESYTLLTIGDGLGGADPGVGDLYRRRRYRHSRRDRSGRRRADGGPAVQQSSRDAAERRGTGAVGLVPGMPNTVFLLFTAALLGWLVAARP